MEERVPEIRFKGFEEKWKSFRFGDIVQIERGGSPRPIDEYITDSPNGLNWIKIGDAPALGRYITHTAEKIKPEGLSKTREVHPGDLILSNSMSFGKPYIMGIEGCIHDGWLLIRDTNNTFDLAFLCHLLSSQQILDQFKAFAAGSTVNNLNKDLVGNTLILFPKIQEQVLDGQYLEQIDTLITFTQQKLDQLKTLKKAFLEKMFPKEGETVPEIRFKGFSEDWETKKISDVCSLSKESIDPRSFSEKYFFEYSMSAYDNGLFPDYVLGSSMNSTRIKVTSECILFNKLNVRKERIWYIKNPKPMSVCSGEFLPLCSTDIYLPFLTQILKSKETTKAMESVSTGSSNSQKRIQPYSLMNYTVMIPKQKQEQRLLGDYFRNLDNLISLIQQKLDHLKNLKKALLDKMFV